MLNLSALNPVFDGKWENWILRQHHRAEIALREATTSPSALVRRVSLAPTRYSHRLSRGATKLCTFGNE